MEQKPEMTKTYVRCPDCHGYSADPLWGDDCKLCENVGNISEDELIKRLGEDEASEILDWYHRRGKFAGCKQTWPSPFIRELYT